MLFLLDDHSWCCVYNCSQNSSNDNELWFCGLWSSEGYLNDGEMSECIYRMAYTKDK